MSKKEVRQLGKKYLADFSFEDEEFLQVLDILCGCTDPRKTYVIPALLLLTMQMIVQLDDALHLKRSTIMVCPKFDFALSVCMRWSKNLSEERDALLQIMLGSMNANFDILLAFGVA
eukprot:14107405-Ditylum_brightwellii.AAC.1